VLGLLGYGFYCWMRADLPAVPRQEQPPSPPAEEPRVTATACAALPGLQGPAAGYRALGSAGTMKEG
jgi:hypothetical protein